MLSMPSHPKGCCSSCFLPQITTMVLEGWSTKLNPDIRIMETLRDILPQVGSHPEHLVQRDGHLDTGRMLAAPQQQPAASLTTLAQLPAPLLLPPHCRPGACVLARPSTAPSRQSPCS